MDAGSPDPISSFAAPIVEALGRLLPQKHWYQEAGTWLGFLGLLAAGGAAWVAYKSYKVARTAPWISFLFERLAEHLLKANDDRLSVETFVSHPFKDHETKKNAWLKLNEARDATAQSLYLLCVLLPSAAAAKAARNKLVAIDDSYLESSDCLMKKDLQTAFLARYSDAQEAYVTELKNLIRSVCAGKYI